MNRQQLVIQRLIEHQRRLYGFVLSILPDANEADDIYQEACTKIWQLADEYDPQRPFMPWACSIAHNLLRNHLAKRRRHRRLFSEATLDQVADRYEQQTDRLEQRRRALQECLKELTEGQREAVELSYSGQATIAEAADMLGQTRDAFYKRLQRIRQKLYDCITRRTGGGES